MRMSKVVEISSHHRDRIAASIEVAPKQAVESSDLPGLFPQGTSVYVTAQTATKPWSRQPAGCVISAMNQCRILPPAV